MIALKDCFVLSCRADLSRMMIALPCLKADKENHCLTPGRGSTSWHSVQHDLATNEVACSDMASP